MARRLFAAVRVMVVAFFLIVVLALPAFAQLRAPPWHLVDVWWDLPPIASFKSLSMEVVVEDDLPSDQSIYLAAIGLGRLRDTKFYGGLLTGAPVPGGGKDRIAIFSRWGERSQDAIRIAPGGFSENSGHEGDFIGVRRAVPWQRGHYLVSLKVVERSSNHNWVKMTVTMVASGQTWNIGMLRFPGKSAALSSQFASFVEIFGKSIKPESIAHATIKYGGLRLNGIPIIPKSAKVFYMVDIPPYALARQEPGGWIAIDIGEAHNYSHLSRTNDGRFFEAFSWR